MEEYIYAVLLENKSNFMKNKYDGEGHATLKGKDGHAIVIVPVLKSKQGGSGNAGASIDADLEGRSWRVAESIKAGKKVKFVKHVSGE